VSQSVAMQELQLLCCSATELLHHLMLEKPSGLVETNECVFDILKPFNEFLGRINGVSQQLECKADLG